jgi:hypothetical protein
VTKHLTNLRICWIALLAAVCHAPGTYCWHGLVHQLGLEHRNCRLHLSPYNSPARNCCWHSSKNDQSNEHLESVRFLIVKNPESNQNLAFEPCTLCATYQNLANCPVQPLAPVLTGIFQRAKQFDLPLIEFSLCLPEARAPPPQILL